MVGNRRSSSGLATYLSHRLLEAAHSFCSWHFFYHYVIDDWGKTLALVTEPIVWLVVLSSWDSC